MFYVSFRNNRQKDSISIDGDAAQRPLETVTEDIPAVVDVRGRPKDESRQRRNSGGRLSSPCFLGMNPESDEVLAVVAVACGICLEPLADAVYLLSFATKRFRVFFFFVACLAQ